MKQKKLVVVLLTLVCAAMAVFGGTLAFAADGEDGGWKIKSGEPEQSADSYGTVFSGTDFAVYNSQSKLWPDKFGVSYRINRTEVGTLDVIVAAQADTWFEDADMSYFRLSLTCSEDLLTTNVSLYAGETLAVQYSTVQVNWTDSYSYSTNDVYFGKAGDTWVINLNDELHEITDGAAVAALDAELEGFTDRIGYLQFESSGQAKLTYVAGRYGIPAAATDVPAGWSNGGVLDMPDWLVTSGDEIVGWTPAGSASYTIRGDDYLIPLNGFDLTMRMAHGSSNMSTVIALTSDYGSNWYAGAYSMGFMLSWNSSMADNQVNLSLLVYTDQTDSSGEEPIRMSTTIQNFNWYGSNSFRVYRSHGIWTLSVNEETVFSDTISEEGRTLNDYFEEIYPYFPGGGGYLEAWGMSVGGEAFVIEDMSLVSSNSIPVSDTLELRKYDEHTYAVGSKVEIDLKTLFTDAEGDTLTYFATKGSINDGVWSYTNDMEELLTVTFRASDSAGTASVRITLHFTAKTQSGETEESDSSGCGASAAGGTLLPCLFVLGAAAVAASFANRKAKKEEKTDENK